MQDLYIDFNGDRIRISGVKLHTQADADELIRAINIVRRLLPGDATEKAVGTPLAGEGTANSPAPIAPLGATTTADGTPPAGGDSAPSSPASQSTGNVGGSAGRSHSGPKLPTRSPASVPVDTTIPPSPAAQTEGTRVPATPSQAGGDAVASPATSSHASGKSAGSTESAAPRRKGLQNEVQLAHEKNPTWNAARIADELNCTVEYVRSTAARLAITLPTARPILARANTLRERVAVLHRQHPTWTPAMVAAELGAKIGTVTSYLTGIRRDGVAQELKLASERVDEGALREAAKARKQRLGVAA